MANVRRLGLTRDQLAKFLDEHEQIRQFELLFTAVDELQTTGIDSTTYDAGAALAGVNKLAGVVAQLAQDGAIDASTALSVAEGVQRALAAIEQAAMMAVTTKDRCCEPTTAELLGSVAPPVVVTPTTAEVMGAVVPPVVATPTTAELLGAVAAPRVHTPSNAELMGAVVPPLVPKRRIAGAWHDMSRQLAVGVNTGTRMQCDSTDIELGAWRDPASDVFYVADAGVYNIEFSAQLDRNKGTDSEFWVWLAIDGADVPESASVVRVKGTDGEFVPSWNWLVKMKPGASFSVMWATDDLDTYLETFAASAFHPAIPSVIITVTQEA